MYAETAVTMVDRFDQRPQRPRAACVGEDPALFFPERENIETLKPAAAVCRTCPIRSRCLAQAIAEDVRGIWAGTTTRQRRVIRKRRGIVPKSLVLTLTGQEIRRQSA